MFSTICSVVPEACPFKKMSLWTDSRDRIAITGEIIGHRSYEGGQPYIYIYREREIIYIYVYIHNAYIQF